jgi:shikimate kinase
MSIVLLGYRGCGKSTIGKRLADKLWQDFFEQQGEAHFRDLEASAVAQALARDNVVVALGGGAVMRPESQQALRSSGHKRIYLRCEPEILLARIQGDPASASARPNLTRLGGGIEEIHAVLSEREPVYRSLMTAELDVTRLSPDEAAVWIVRLS